VAVTSSPRATAPAAPRPVVPIDVDRRSSPVKWWAALGCAIWAFQAFILLKWLTGPFFTPVHSGPDSPPTAMKIAIITYLTLQWLAFAYLLNRFVIRPLRRDRRLGFDGLMFISWAGFYWFWDPLGNWNGLTWTYNSWIPNMGAWTQGIPGWLTPQTPGHMGPEPWLFTGGAYPVCFSLMAIFACWQMRRMKARWPQLGLVSLTIWAFMTMFALETILESVWMRIGLYSYPGTPNGLITLFPSHYYRFPLFEGFVWAAALMVFAVLRYNVNDRGETIAERGLDDVKTGNPRKQAMRLMAITGCAYTGIFFFYWLPLFTVWGNHPGHWPLDVQRRSYLTDYLCGPDTTVACPGPDTPFPRPNSVRLAPDGKLYLPHGTKLPVGPTTFADANALYKEGHR
jgi:Spirocyclase AveC-like